ncbi:UDP-glucose--hexose-1-phosphate uridylyltransferase [bacterium]|nr:UDP-glucose--hexose-1-phosphate uridylyltransferase [bacterium]
MPTLDLSLHPHRRYNPLLGEWILVSPHRTRRPWSGQIEAPPPEHRLRYEPDCYLCPGNVRAGGARNPDFDQTFVFDNDFAALLPDTPHVEVNLHDERLLRLQGEPGVCRVVVFSPRHDVTLADMSPPEVGEVVRVWTVQYQELGARDEINHVLIFENKGAMMGCSNPHPHSQIWASHRIPTLVERELSAQRLHLEESGRCLLCEYAALEARLGERVVAENAHFLCVVPFWATWPYELLVLPRRHLISLSDFDDDERVGLADMLSTSARMLNRIFSTDCPYSMGIHQAPTDGREYPGLHLHLHYFPPLLRSATIKKFLVGYEMAAEPQRDLTPEQAAEKLRRGRL